MSVADAIAAAGRPWPAPLHHLQTVESTNDWLRGLVRREPAVPEWTAVYTDRQTGGRGRQGRTWTSADGDVLVSLLVRPGPAAAPFLPLMTGVAVHDALREGGGAVALKWPNDIVHGDRKVGGILVEALGGASGIECAVIGVGLNLETPRAAMPAPASSIREAGWAGATRDEALAALLRHVAGWYHVLSREGPAAVREAWRARAVDWWGHPVEARDGASVVRGIARGLHANGGLLLEMPDGTERVVLSADVRQVRRTP